MTQRSSEEPTPPSEQMERHLANDLKNLRNRLMINHRRLEYGLPPVKLDQASATETRLTTYRKHQYALLKEMHDDLEAKYTALKKMAKKHNIKLLENKADIPTYLQIPSRGKPKSPWDDAHALRRSIQIAKEMKKEEDTEQDDDDDPKPLKSNRKREQDTQDISGDEKSSSKKPKQQQQETGSDEDDNQGIPVKAEPDSDGEYPNDVRSASARKNHWPADPDHSSHLRKLKIYRHKLVVLWRHIHPDVRTELLGLTEDLTPTTNPKHKQILKYIDELNLTHFTPHEMDIGLGLDMSPVSTQILDLYAYFDSQEQYQYFQALFTHLLEERPWKEITSANIAAQRVNAEILANQNMPDAIRYTFGWLVCQSFGPHSLLDFAGSPIEQALSEMKQHLLEVDKNWPPFGVPVKNHVHSSQGPSQDIGNRQKAPTTSAPASTTKATIVAPDTKADPMKISSDEGFRNSEEDMSPTNKEPTAGSVSDVHGTSDDDADGKVVEEDDEEEREGHSDAQGPDNDATFDNTRNEQLSPENIETDEPQQLAEVDAMATEAPNSSSTTHITPSPEFKDYDSDGFDDDLFLA